MYDCIHRHIDYLRVSVTDRCNLRCVYCMPEADTPHAADMLLRDDEILRLCRILSELGVTRIKLTGGEPLCRPGLPELTRTIKALPGIRQVTLTTNGTLLAASLDALEAAGLDAVNISLDTLNPALYRALTRCGSPEPTLEAIRAAVRRGRIPVKINCVLFSREQALWDVAELARELPVQVRFIETMPIGFRREQAGPSEAEARAVLAARFGPLTPDPDYVGNGPAIYCRAAGFSGRLGFISAMSHKFCGSCNRIRLTSDGFLRTCLQYAVGADLGAMLRAGAGDEALRSAAAQAIWDKPAGHHFDRSPAGDRTMNRIGG